MFTATLLQFSISMLRIAFTALFEFLHSSIFIFVSRLDNDWTPHEIRKSSENAMHYLIIYQYALCKHIKLIYFAVTEVGKFVLHFFYKNQ